MAPDDQNLISTSQDAGLTTASGSTNEIFRPEALKRENRSYLTTIAVAPTSTGWLMLIAGVTTCLVIGLVLSVGQFARHETADGTLVPTQALTTVVPMSPGTVTRILVNEGDTVKAEDPLVELAADPISSDLGETKSAMARQLNLKRARLESDRIENDKSHAIQLDALMKKKASLLVQLQRIKEQLVIEAERTSEAEKLYASFLKVRQSVPGIQIIQQHDLVLQHQAQLSQLHRQEAEMSSQVEQTIEDFAQLPSSKQTKDNAIARELTDVAQTLSQVEVEHAVLIRSPQSGIVTNLLIHVGQSVSTQQFLLNVLPSNVQLNVEMWLPSRSIGFVKKGDEVLVRYVAYPFRRYGLHYVSPTGI